MLKKRAFISTGTQTDGDLIFKVLRDLDNNFELSLSHDESSSEKSKTLRKKKTGRPKKFTHKSKNDDEEIDDYILDTIGESGIINDCNEAKNIFIRKPEINSFKLVSCRYDRSESNSPTKKRDSPGKYKQKKKFIFQIKFPTFISSIKDRNFNKIFKKLVKSITSIESQNFYDDLKYFKKSGKDMNKFCLAEKVSIFLYWLGFY